jgi:competence protein ComGC
LAFGYLGSYASNLVQALLVIAIISVLSAFIFPENQEKQTKLAKSLNTLKRLPTLLIVQ